MKRLILSLVLICTLLFACGPHPRLKQKQKVKEESNQEVVIILSPFLKSYSYDTLGSVEVELKRHKPDQEKSLPELLLGLPLSGGNPWLTTTEEMLTKLLKKAQSMRANAVTNLEIGSYDAYGYLHTEDWAGYQHVVYAKATVLLIHDFTGLPAPKTIVKDRAYIRVQSTSHPINKNAIVLLSPFVKRMNHEVAGEIKVTSTAEKVTGLTLTEEILQKLMRETALRGANALTKLEIGSFELLKYSHQQDVLEQKHETYGRAIAIKILPQKPKK
jgi:hypothetical protein